MSYLLLLIVLSAAAYRVGRFIVLDTLIDGARNRVLDILERRNQLWATKLLELLGCPWCITMWTALGVLGAAYPFVDTIPLPVFTWLTVATGALVFWTVIDSE